MKLRPLTKDEVFFKIEAIEEDFHYNDPGNHFSSEVIQGFKKMVEKAGLWGWCCVKVTANWKTSEASPRFESHPAYLGGASYLNEEDFIKNSGYYEQLCDEALDNLNKEIDSCFQALLSLAQK